MQVNNYDAEAVRTSGGVFNVTACSGSNQIHGSLFGFLRPNPLRNNFFNNRNGIERPDADYALLYPAFTLAGLITINQLLTVVVTDRLSEAPTEVKFNRELIAQGAANMVCPFFGAPPGVAMLARTVATARGSRQPLVGARAQLNLNVVPASAARFDQPDSAAVLAAVTIAIGMQLIDWKRFRNLPRMNQLDAALFLLTFCLVIFSDLIVGVGVGSLIAMLLFVERAAQSTQLEPIVSDPAKKEPSAMTFSHGPSSSVAELQAEMQMYRLAGPLFFTSSEKAPAKLTREVTAKTLALNLTEAGPIDSAATDCLRPLARRQRQRGGERRLIGLDQRLFASITKDGLLEEVGAIVWRDEELNNSFNHPSNNSSGHYPLRQVSFRAAESQTALHFKQLSPYGGK